MTGSWGHCPYVWVNILPGTGLVAMRMGHYTVRLPLVFCLFHTCPLALLFSYSVVVQSPNLDLPSLQDCEPK